MLDTSNFKKNVVFVTGTRADFGKLEPLIIKTRDSGFNVSIFITGMHLMKRYGMTKIEVNRLSGVQFTEFPNQTKNYTQDIMNKPVMEIVNNWSATHQDILKDTADLFTKSNVIENIQKNDKWWVPIGEFLREFIKILTDGERMFYVGLTIIFVGLIFVFVNITNE